VCDHLRAARQLGGGARCRLALVVAEDGARLGEAEDRGQLVALHRRVDRGEGGARERRAEDGAADVEAVRHRQHDTVPAPHSAAVEPRRDRLGRRQQLRPGERLAVL
jgi:hypothetical protein